MVVTNLMGLATERAIHYGDKRPLVHYFAWVPFALSWGAVLDAMITHYDDLAWMSEAVLYVGASFPRRRSLRLLTRPQCRCNFCAFAALAWCKRCRCMA